MTCYRVSFFKNVLSSDGHPFKCIQRIINVRHARSADRAVQAAKRRYERLRHTRDWKLHADYLELEVDSKKVDYCPTGGERSRIRHNDDLVTDARRSDACFQHPDKYHEDGIPGDGAHALKSWRALQLQRT